MTPTNRSFRTLPITISLVVALILLAGLTMLVEAADGDAGTGKRASVTAPTTPNRPHPAASLRGAASLPTVPDAYGVALSAVVTTGMGAPGESIDYTLVVTNTGDERDNFFLTASGTWTATISPSAISLDGGEVVNFPALVEVPAGATPGDSDTVTVTATSEGDPGISASVALEAIAVEPPPCEGCDPIAVETVAPTGTNTVEVTATAEILTLTERSGLVAPPIVAASVTQDPTPFDPFDDLDQVFYMTETVTAGTLRLVAEVLASEASDVDIYLGRDADNDNIPDENEVICAPFSHLNEYCAVEVPDPGTWWIVVQSFFGSGNAADDVTMTWATIAESDIDNGYLDVTGPASTPAGQPVDLDLHYDLGGLSPAPGAVFYGGFSLGSEPGSPTDVDTIIPVDIRYLGTPPQIVVAPASISATLPLGGESEQTLTISNAGGERLLEWQIAEDGPPPAAPLDSHLIVGDGSFEEGSPNPYWNEGGDILPPLCNPDLCGPEYARSGDWWAWFGGWSTTNTTWISQAVTIPAAETAVLSFYFHMVGNPQTGPGLFEVSLDGNVVAIYGGEAVHVYGTHYRRATVDIGAYADGGAHELMFRFQEIAASVLLDDVAIDVDVSMACTVPEDVPWLSPGSGSGATAPGASSEVDVILDAGGLAAGRHAALLCIESDDPATPLVPVPVTLEVRHVSYLPAVFKAAD